ncbi:MAG: MarR family transcriptional regulator [Bacteriovorax sp.]|jgi:DNA-binding MarR family transcriptional regulator
MNLEKAVDIKFMTIYRELATEYPNILPEAIESSLQFKTIAAQILTKRDELFNSFGVTSGRFHLLMILKVESSRALSPSELAKRTNVTRATMTQFVDALEKEEYVKRTDDPKDRRGMLVKLTQKGADKLNEIMPHYVERMSNFTSCLTKEERGQLHIIMNKIHSSFYV